MCAAEGRTERAVVVDHVERVDGSYERFRLCAVQSLCRAHHERTKRYVERHGYLPDIDVTGMPVDRRHPVYGRGADRPAPAKRVKWDPVA